MKAVANSSAVVSACTAAASWVDTLDHALRMTSTAIAIVAGVLAIIVYIRTLRKKKDKK